MIRLTTTDDVTDLSVLAEASGLFEPSQTEELVQMLGQHFNGETGVKICGLPTTIMV